MPVSIFPLTQKRLLRIHSIVMLRNVQVDLFNKPNAAPVDLLICDEAHRLKNNETKTTKALDSLSCRRRVLLSGTPMQNHLDEVCTYHISLFHRLRHSMLSTECKKSDVPTSNGSLYAVLCNGQFLQPRGFGYPIRVPETLREPYSCKPRTRRDTGAASKGRGTQPGAQWDC